MRVYIIIVGLVSFAAIALGQDAGDVMDIAEVTKPAEDLALEVVTKTEPDASAGWVAKIIGFAIAAQLMLRGLAEGLTRISVLTKNKTDNKIAAYLSQAAWFLGAFMGKFGYSVPKLVVEEAKKKEEKK